MGKVMKFITGFFSRLNHTKFDEEGHSGLFEHVATRLKCGTMHEPVV